MNKIKFGYALSKCLLILIGLVFVGCSEEGIEQEFFGDIVGTVVTASDGTPLENVKITTTPSTTTVFTNANGTFSLENVGADNYSVMAELDDFDTSFEGVEVVRDEESVVVFELVRRSFSLDPPTAPVLVSPEDGADDLGAEVLFEWEPSVSNGETLTYEVEIRNAITNEMLDYTVVNDSTLTVSDLDLGQNYFWQVIASDGENDTVASLVRTFSTQAFPSNSFLFVRKEDSGNSVIFSGGGEFGDNNEETDENLFQLTSDGTNSYRPHRDTTADKIAFLRSVGGNTHIFTMDYSGQNVTQVTNAVAVNGFRQDEIDFTWAANGSKLLYPSFDKVYSINADGTNLELIYTTPDGSLVSEVDVQEFDQDVLLLKTNNFDGYNVRIFTHRLSTMEDDIILEDVPGAAGGVEISRDGQTIIYSKDTSNNENQNYVRLNSRIFIYNTDSETVNMLDTNVNTGDNDLDPSFSPSEGQIVYTRVGSGADDNPGVFIIGIDTGGQDDDQLFTLACMPDF